jgi:hypothetical protein
MKKHHNSPWNELTLQERRRVTPSEWDNDSDPSHELQLRGIYRGRFTYTLLLLYLFIPQQLYSSNIIEAYNNFLSNPPL